ncbi:hypothetical protein LEMLEM_LOCUS21008, partial [Lemmus lemmus]
CITAWLGRLLGKHTVLRNTWAFDPAAGLLTRMTINTEAHIWSGCRGPETMECSALKGTTVSQPHPPRLR